MSSNCAEIAVIFSHAFGRASCRCGTRRHLPAWCAASPARRSRGGRVAIGIAQAVEAGQRLVDRRSRCQRVVRVCRGLDDLGAAAGGGAAEHHQVESASWSPGGWRHAPRRRPPRPRPSGRAPRASGLSPRLGQHLAVVVGGDAAHVVVHGRQDRDRLLGARRRRRRSCAIRRCPAGARAAPWDRGGPGAGGCGPCARPRRDPRGSRWSCSARPRRARPGPCSSAHSAP